MMIYVYLSSSLWCTDAGGLPYLSSIQWQHIQASNGKGRKRASYQGCCSDRLYQEEGCVDQSGPDPRGVTGTLSCWSQMLRSLPSVLLLLLALLMMMIAAALVLNDRDWVKKRTTGTQPEEEVGVGQVMTLDQPVDHVMSESCAIALHQSILVGNELHNSIFHHAPTGRVKHV